MTDLISSSFRKNSDTNNNEIKSLIEMDKDQERKLFIAGLTGSITETNLKEYFEKFGKIEQIVIKRDFSSKPKFAFITMENQESAQKILESVPIEIKGKAVDVKLAKYRPIAKKIFVGGIDGNIAKDEIAKYFSKFGNVIDIELAYDHFKKKHREFCFIIFDTEEAANLAVKEPKQMIFDRKCDVKKATPLQAHQQKRQQNLQQSFNSQQYPLSQSRNSNSKTFYPSPNSVKSSNSYRGNYYRKNFVKNQFSNGRRSSESQPFNQTNNYEYNYRKNLNSRSQYLSNSAQKHQHAQNTNYDQQYNQNQYYQNYANYHVPNQYYQNYANYHVPNYDFYNNQYAQYGYQTATQYHYASNSINPSYNNYQLANSTVDTQQTQITSNDQNYQTLDERYYQDQYKYDNVQDDYNLTASFEAAYQQQPVMLNDFNKNNLINQYQDSIQQC